MSAIPTRGRRPESIPPLEVFWFVLILAFAVAMAARLIWSNFGDRGDEVTHKGATQ